jgi:hypothetical protein
LGSTTKSESLYINFVKRSRISLNPKLIKLKTRVKITILFKPSFLLPVTKMTRNLTSTIKISDKTNG